jgi:hypothetical protein
MAVHSSEHVAINAEGDLHRVEYKLDQVLAATSPGDA